MRVLTVADLHQRRALYEQLAAAVAVHKPDVVALVGDFLDLDGTGEGRLTPEAAACELATLTAGREVVFCPGNHENFDWPRFELTWRAIRPDLHALHGSSVTIDGLAIVGFPCQMGDRRYYAHGRPLADYACEAWLPPLMAQLGGAGRGLWLMHEPPVVALAEGWATCPEWGRAIEEFQPLVTISGHDHNTPIHSGVWQTAVGRTVCVSAGQRLYPQPGQLIYCTLTLEAATDGSPRLVGVQRHGV